MGYLKSTPDAQGFFGSYGGAELPPPLVPISRKSPRPTSGSRNPPSSSASCAISGRISRAVRHRSAFCATFPTSAAARRSMPSARISTIPAHISSTIAWRGFAGEIHGQDQADGRNRRRSAWRGPSDGGGLFRHGMRDPHGRDRHRQGSPQRHPHEASGAQVVPVGFGGRSLKEAVDSCFQSYVAQADTALIAIGSVVGPHPFPRIVRDFQHVVGIEARAQFLEMTGQLPDMVAACVGGGSNAMGIFAGFIEDRMSRCTASNPMAPARNWANTPPPSPMARMA